MSAALLAPLMTVAFLLATSIRNPSRADRRPAEIWAAARAAGPGRCAVVVTVLVAGLVLCLLSDAARLIGWCARWGGAVLDVTVEWLGDWLVTRRGVRA